jgi:hypothetical protein
MTIAPDCRAAARGWLGLAARAGSVLRSEGAAALLARARQSRALDARRIERRYPAWAASRDRERPPTLSRPPLLSVVTPVKDPPLEVLRATARSVQAQRGVDLEWCIVDDASERDSVRTELARIAAEDPRVRLSLLERGHGIAAATNEALRGARGELIAFLDHDDALAPDALAWMQAAFEPGTGAAYSDQDRIDGAGARCFPSLKPGLSQDLLLATNYLAHLLVVRHDLLREVGPLDPALDGAQDYDLALKLAERTRIAHVPRVLYHWRAIPGSAALDPRAKPWALAAGRRAVEAALARRRELASVEDGPWPGTHGIAWPVPDLAVSVLVPGGSRADVARWRSVPGVVEARSVPRGALGSAARRARGSTVAILGPGLALAPESASEADARVALAAGTAALARLASHAHRPTVAVATPRVLARDGTLESAGLALGFGRAGVAACPLRGLVAEDGGHMGLARITRDVSAAPADALVIERAKLERLGGLPDVADAWLGVTVSLRGREVGLRTVVVAEAALHRLRGGPARPSWESAERLRRELGAEVALEPHLSPSFRRRRDVLEL